jgi:predicted RNA-binding protein Jag
MEFLSDLIISNHDVLNYLEHVESYLNDLIEEVDSKDDVKGSEKKRIINNYLDPEQLQKIVEDFVDRRL